ncbi:TRAF-type zinc finger domain-containing protein 1-like isoform X2 [Ptychodera flava]|uniref:TRAF-type zinc finger domain-containing protein 1-like isoform X2 n=1 Tax=Ptychodera flava TaxID=63121 RepID=UPI00396A0127
MGDQSAEVETQRCSNCKKDIPAANFIMHQTHCQRNIILCKHCKEPVPRSEMDNHIDELHVQVTCKCGEIMEKRLLEDHEATDCTSRKVLCEFCELEMAYSELSNHQDFCGTRTEPCTNCGRYIMLKDLQRHEDSLCQYPEVKPSPPKNVSRSVDYYPDEFTMDFGPYSMYNPYADPSGSIHNEFRTKPREPKPSNLRSQPGRSGQPARSRPSVPLTSSPNNLKKTTSRKTVPVPRTQNRTHASETKNFSQRPKNQPVMPTNDEEADRILAMHLAHDLTSFDDVDSLIESANQIPDPPKPSLFHSRLTSRGPPISLPDYDSDDEEALPCEFCGDLFPSDVLQFHQSSCQEPAQSSPTNNSVPISPTSRSHLFQPEIVDNLGYGNSPPSRDHPTYDEYVEEDTGDMLFLPCEFCEELLPADSLVQHQAVCDADRCKTPWPTQNQDPSPLSSPDTVRTKSRLKERKPLTNTGYGYPGRSSRRQQDPTFAFRPDEDRSPKQKDFPRKTNPLPSTNPPYGSRYSMQSKTKQKNPVGPFHPASKARLKSAERTRKTLDDLLADENVNTDELLEHMGRQSAYGRENKDQMGMDNGYWDRQYQDSRRSHETQYPEDPGLDEFDIFLNSQKESHAANSHSRRGRQDEEDDMPMGYEASLISNSQKTKPANRQGRANPHARTSKSKSTNVHSGSGASDLRAPGATSSSRSVSRSSQPPNRGAVPKSRKPSNYRRNGGTDV